MPLVYAELRRIADGYLRRERSGHTLQPTALVHEAWLRLINQEQPQFANRLRFYALAAQMMRQILVDHARRVGAAKRGGRAPAISLQVIELRYFGGLNVEETAEILGVSIATVSREQKTAEAWLSQAMSNEN
jgi:RNA polymerase sigma-70 factor (ECF subfamily)